MQYIECIHCHKRYPANKKMRAAIGKKIRCTECWRSFPIVVYEISSESASASADDNAGKTPETPE